MAKSLPIYVIVYLCLTVIFVIGQLVILDIYVCRYRSSLWMILYAPFDLVVVLLMSFVLQNSAKPLRLSDDISELSKAVIQPNSNYRMVLTWACYLFNVFSKMFLVFAPARSLSVFELFGPNLLINTARLIPVIFYLLYNVATCRARQAQLFLLSKQSDPQNYYADNGEIRQLTYDVALDLLDASELYHVFSYFSSSHGQSTAYNRTPFDVPLTSVNVSFPFQIFANSTSGFESLTSPLEALVNTTVDLSQIFPFAQDVCHSVSNVETPNSEWISQAMLVFTALAGAASLYSMVVFEHHFFPILRDDGDMDFDFENENQGPEVSRASQDDKKSKRPKRFRWYSLLTLFCVNVPAFLLRFVLWVSFRVSISPLIIKNILAILIFLQ
eukprot:c14946_g1_i1.p1 GENE.c14946_g1_i1~~c14946_g1_i1.p1  ORF type:complete len:409 (+),score=75.30 c14946_g1_i1:74-1228(+)